MDAEKLLALTKINLESAWIQRLGYLLDLLGQDQLSVILRKELEHRRMRQCALQVGSSINEAKLDKKWQVWANIELESEV